MGRNLKLRLCAAALVVASAVVAFIIITSQSAWAADQVHDEIQVYNAEIADVGQWTLEQHLNYVATGQTQPEVPGGFYSNHALQGTPEFAYGITDWWEGGFYIPFAATELGPIPVRWRKDPQPVRGPGRRQAQLLLWRQFRARL